MKYIGITGNIGSGKSTIAHLFRLMGIPVYVADNEARKFFSEQAVINDIVRIAGSRILNDQAQINRNILAEILFPNPELLSAVNRIIHPLVLADYHLWSINQQQAPFTLFESAIIFEQRLESNFSTIIDVYCPEDLAIKRASKRDHETEAQIKLRLSHQLNAEIKSKKSDFIILNDERHSIITQTLALYNKLSKQ
jgi:dephospho-CoA kinase